MEKIGKVSQGQKFSTILNSGIKLRRAEFGEILILTRVKVLYGGILIVILVRRK
jgi:hypothetical protein